MSISSHDTSLTLDRYAKLMGINPISFSGAVLLGIDTPLVPPGGSCDSTWFQYSWQNNDQIAREDLAASIEMAESELHDFVGYYFTPTWIIDENHVFEEHYRKEYYGLGRNDNIIKTRVSNCYVTDVGVRKRTLLYTANTTDGTLSFIDKDGDTFEEVAKIVINITGMSVNQRDVRVCYHDMMDDETHDIKYAKYVSVYGNTLTMEFDSWLLLDYTLWEQYPNAQGEKAIDITANDKFVDSVDVFIEEVDITKPAVTFYWEDEGELLTQDGWMNISGHYREFASIYPAYYESGKWNRTYFSYPEIPSYYTINYRAGRSTNYWPTGKFPDGLTDDFAQTIVWLSTARLERDFCQCGNASTFADSLREDLSSSGQGQNTYFIPIDKIENPFGTRRGELMAWAKVSKYGIKKRDMTGATI